MFISIWGIIVFFGYFDRCMYFKLILLLFNLVFVWSWGEYIMNYVFIVL